MKELHGSAQATVAASVDEAFELLAAVDRYPTWHPEVVRRVDVTGRDAGGAPSKVNALLHLSQGPLAKDFDLDLIVTTQLLSAVSLSKVSLHSNDEETFEVSWRIEGSEGTTIRLELLANLAVPRFLPVGGIGNSVAEGFVAAAASQLVAAGSGRP